MARVAKVKNLSEILDAIREGDYSVVAAQWPNIVIAIMTDPDLFIRSLPDTLKLAALEAEIKKSFVDQAQEDLEDDDEDSEDSADDDDVEEEDDEDDEDASDDDDDDEDSEDFPGFDDDDDDEEEDEDSEEEDEEVEETPPAPVKRGRGRPPKAKPAEETPAPRAAKKKKK